MKRNVGTTDKTIRFIVVGVISGLIFSKTIVGTLAVVLAILAVILFVTGIIRWCGLYTALGINTDECCGGSKEEKSGGCSCCDDHKDSK